MLGASMVKWTKKNVCWNTKFMGFFLKKNVFCVKVSILVAQCCLNWILFHDDLYCCVKYSNVAYQVEIFRTCRYN